jgi:hypothetical protein
MPSPNLSRVTRAYASGSNRSRVNVGQVNRQEQRTVTADFNGLLAAADTIDEVVWRCNSPWVLAMSSAAIDGKAVTVLADFQNGGHAMLKATITTAAGAIYSQLFDFTVRDCPTFQEEAVPSAGPYSLTVSA